MRGEWVGNEGLTKSSTFALIIFIIIIIVLQTSGWPPS
jgi:hypothetical protein